MVIFFPLAVKIGLMTFLLVVTCDDSGRSDFMVEDQEVVVVLGGILWS